MCVYPQFAPTNITLIFTKCVCVCACACVSSARAQGRFGMNKSQRAAQEDLFGPFASVKLDKRVPVFELFDMVVPGGNS